MIRRPLPLLSALAAAVLLAACGGGNDATTDGATTTGTTTTTTTTTTAADLPCNTALFVAGAVAKPTATQLAAYAGTYDGGEGSYGPNPGDPFVKSRSVVLVVNTDGTVSYDGTAYTPVSVCRDNTAGPYGQLLYVHTDKGHLDIADKADATLGQAWGVSLADGVTIFQGAVKR